MMSMRGGERGGGREGAYIRVWVVGLKEEVWLMSELLDGVRY